MIETCSVRRRGFFIGRGTSTTALQWIATPPTHPAGAPGAPAVARGSDTRGVFETGLYRNTH
jgi:hypothetical protein